MSINLLMPMNVVLDGLFMLPNMTGIGRYILGLLEGFTNIDESFRCELWLQSKLPEASPIWNYQSSQIRMKKLSFNHKSIRQIWEIPLLVKQTKPDVFHIPHINVSPYTPGLIVTTIHDLKYIVRSDFFVNQKKLKRLIFYLMTTIALHKSAQVITVSKHTRIDLLKYFKIDPTKVSAVLSGVSSIFFKSKEIEEINDFRKRVGLIDPFLLFVGERRPHKNLPNLIRAFHKFQTMGYKRYHLVIAGKSYTDYREPEKVTEELDLKDFVHFLDYFSEEELPLLYQTADIFVLISNYEGFGLPILEAMASKTPVVAAKNTSLNEVAGKAALLVNENDIEEIATSFTHLIPGGVNRELFIKRGVARAHDFTWNKTATNTLSIYQKALS